MILHKAYYHLKTQLLFYYITFRRKKQEENAKVTKFPHLEQNIFVIFIYFGYCNLKKSMVYYSHIKEVQSDGKVR